MIEIIVNPDSLERSEGSITGQIYLRGPAGSFPDEGWYDFPVVILTWWVAGLSLVASGDRRSFVGDFMDGPLSFRVDADEGDVARIAWGDCGSESTIGTIGITSLLQSAIAAGLITLESCRARNWASDDMERLEQAIHAARPNNSFKPNPLRGSA